MKRTVFNAFGVVVAVVLQSMAGGVVEINNASFEQVGANGYPKGWSECRNWHGERNGHNGSGGIVYECNDISKAFNREHVRQKVNLQPGKRYRISGLVKTMNLVTERKSNSLGITVYICGFNADGKIVFSTVARPFVKGTSKDWVKVEGITAEVPDGVVEAYVGPLADGRCTGVGIVDDVYVEELDTAPVTGVFTDAYRNESADGEVKFVAALNIDRKVAVNDCTAEFSYMAADGKRRSFPAKVLSHREAVATIDTKAFAIGTNDVKCAVFVSGAKIGEASVSFARLPESVKRKVFIDRYGRTIVDGKPFFPLGMFSGKVDKATLDVYAEGPFNCIMPYVRPEKAEFDLCHAKNMKVIFFLNGGWGTKDGGKGWIENRIATFKDHPATLAWYLSDEPSLNMAPKLAVRRGWAHAADPDHPTWVVLDRPSNVRYYIDSFDVYAMDRYPVPNKPIGEVFDSMREGNAATLKTKPVWYVPQSFGWGWLNRPRTHGRGPNRDELANMTWQSIAGGANGIIYYSFGQVMKRPRDGSVDCFEAAWERAKSAASEVKKYESVLLSAECAPVVPGAADKVAVRTWRHEGYVYLLAVNCTADSQKVTLTLPAPAKLVSSEFGPVPEIGGTEIRIDFPPIGYVMMQLDM
jgi:hypothetical protein